MTAWNVFLWFSNWAPCWFTLKVTVTRQAVSTEQCCPVISTHSSQLPHSSHSPGQAVLVLCSRWPWLAESWGWPGAGPGSAMRVWAETAWGTCATTTSTSQGRRLVTCDACALGPAWRKRLQVELSTQSGALLTNGFWSKGYSSIDLLST